MTTRLAGTFALVLLATPTSAAAQQAPAAPIAPARNIELSVGGLFAAPSPAGSASASLLTPGGSNLDVFDIDSTFGYGYGAEAIVGFRVAPRLWIEASGGITRTTARSEISSDLESGPSLTVSENLSRFSAEGAVRVDLADPGTTTWFVRGGGGWMRELAGGNALVENGFIFNAGGGVRHWFRDNRAGAVKQIGLRLEGRVMVRTAGIEFGSRSLRMGPGAAGALIFGF
jgi:hypothetical protein